MKKIIYYVASSIDGYISGPDDDISLFAQEGEGVQQYLKDLENFKTVIMGRKTYEFGYQYGLQAGKAAYPHMQHYIFSKNLKFNDSDDNVNVCELSVGKINQIKQRSETDIYLCGGGELAGFLLERGLIDVLKLKLNPIILGGGTKIFGTKSTAAKMQLIDQMSYPDGLQILKYRIN